MDKYANHSNPRRCVTTVSYRYGADFGLRFLQTNKQGETGARDAVLRSAGGLENAALNEGNPKRKMQIFYKSLVWCTKCSRKINRITQIDCKSRDESNEPN